MFVASQNTDANICTEGAKIYIMENKNEKYRYTRVRLYLIEIITYYLNIYTFLIVAFLFMLFSFEWKWSRIKKKHVHENWQKVESFIM